MQLMPRWERKICSDHINWRVNCSLNSLTLRSSGINLFGRSNYHLRKWRIPLSSRSFSRLVKFESRFELLFNHMVFCQFTPIWRIVGIILSESFERKKQKKWKKYFRIAAVRCSTAVNVLQNCEANNVPEMKQSQFHSFIFYVSLLLPLFYVEWRSVSFNYKRVIIKMPTNACA